MNKPSRPVARPLRDLLGKVVGDTFTRQGFASAELVTRWPEIAGAEIAAVSEPIKIQWPRASRPAPASAGSGCGQPAGTLVLRVEGPAAIEIQHLAQVICERVNRFLGWRAIERIALRQAPLRRTVAQVTSENRMPPLRHGLPRASRRSPTTTCGRRWRGSVPRSNARDCRDAIALVPERVARERLRRESGPCRNRALAERRAGATFALHLEHDPKRSYRLSETIMHQALRIRSFP